GRRGPARPPARAVMKAGREEAGGDGGAPGAPPGGGGGGGPCRGPSHTANHRVRPAALRVLPATVPRGQDPHRATPAGADRRARRVLLPRQRPRSTRDTHHPAPSRDGSARPPELRRRQQTPAQVLPAL